MPPTRTRTPEAGPAPVYDPRALNDGFAPLTALQSAMRFWWFIVLLAIAGGGVGWLLHLTRPPVYEAAAQFSAGIDYVSTGPLTQFEEDTALNAVGDLLLSLTQSVANQANAEGIPIQVADFRNDLTFERKVNVWVIRIRSTNPQTADRLAAIYAEQGRAALLESYQHTQAADRLGRYMQSLENCLSRSAANETADVLCSRYRLVEIQSDLQAAGKAYDQERVASHGLFSGLLIGPSGVAYQAGRPVLFAQNQLVLAGCLIGFVAGICLVQIDIPARWMRRNVPC